MAGLTTPAYNYDPEQPDQLDTDIYQEHTNKFKAAFEKLLNQTGCPTPQK